MVDNWNYNVPAAMLINKCVTPVWIVIGVFGNVISALVWANPRMRTCNTAAYYLTSLALADLTFLVLHFIYELENPWLLGTLDVFVWCQIFSIANIAVQYFCVFLVFAFTVERFLSVCHPFKSERFGKTRTPRTITLLFLASLGLSLPQGYFWHISFVGECGVRFTEIQTQSIFSIYTWCTELAVFGVIPLIVLLLNVAVLHKIRNIGKLNLGKTKSLTLESTTVTLLWVSFYLIFTMLPNTILYALQATVKFGPMPCRIEDMAKDPDWSVYFSFTTVRIIVKEMSLSHHVGNVFIYLATSRRFL
ncbi:unnamed protein product, partial [Lymnaea stagnalis]